MWAFMMAVSCTKAMLVILFFMHVKYEANWKYVLTIPGQPHVHLPDADAGARCRPPRSNSIADEARGCMAARAAAPTMRTAGSARHRHDAGARSMITIAPAWHGHEASPAEAAGPLACAATAHVSDSVSARIRRH